MLIFINPDLSSSALLPVILLMQGGEALKLSTSIPAITNYPKSSSLGYFKSNLRSTLTQTSGILDSQQRLNKQSVQRIRYSTLRGGKKPRVNNCSFGRDDSTGSLAWMQQSIIHSAQIHSISLLNWVIKI